MQLVTAHILEHVAWAEIAGWGVDLTLHPDGSVDLCQVAAPLDGGELWHTVELLETLGITLAEVGAVIAATLADRDEAR